MADKVVAELAAPSKTLALLQEKAVGDRLRRYETPEDSRHLDNELEPEVVQHVVDAHHGRVHIASEPGEGTTVTVELPASVRRSDHPSPQERVTAPTWPRRPSP